MIKLSEKINETFGDLLIGQQINENYELLMEKLITVGGKRYPNFGHVVIMAGGAGSGKGFVQDMMLGVEGKVFDVDELKKLVMKSTDIRKKIKDTRGVDVRDLDLKNPNDTSDLHLLIGKELNLPDKREQAMFASVLTAHPDRKPNLIFDNTLKDMNKLGEVTDYAKRLGYDPKNIHIVWVINDIDVAIEQNKGRDRVVPKDILLDTHSGTARTMGDLLKTSTDVTKYMDGDIWFVFNKRFVDATLTHSDIEHNRPNSQTPKHTSKQSRSFSIKDANTVLIKKSGQRLDRSKLDFRVVKNILDYIPDNVKDVEFR